MNDLSTKLEEFRIAKEKADLAKKEADYLGKQVKSMMKDSNIVVAEHLGFKYDYKTQYRSKVNEEALIDYLKEHKLNEAISLTEVVNEDVLVEMINTGQVDSGEIEQFIERKEIVTLYVRKLKEPKKEDNQLWD